MKQMHCMAGATVVPDTLASSPLQMVIVGQFRPHSNVTQSKYTDASLSINHPLLCLAVGLAGVIDKACSVAFACGIDDLQGAAHSQHPSAPRLLFDKLQSEQHDQ